MENEGKLVGHEGAFYGIPTKNPKKPKNPLKSEKSEKIGFLSKRRPLDDFSWPREGGAPEAPRHGLGAVGEGRNSSHFYRKD